MTIRLSRELKHLRDQMMMTAASGRSMSSHELRSISLQLDPLIELAEIDEQELQVFRLTEAGKYVRSMIEDLAGEAMGNMMLDGDKIIRPDFGRKP